MAGVVDGVQVIVQRLKFFFAAKSSSGFNHGAENVIQCVEIAIGLERSSQIFGRILQLSKNPWQCILQVLKNGVGITLRLPFGVAVRLPLFDTQSREIVLCALRGLVKAAENLIEF